MKKYLSILLLILVVMATCKTKKDAQAGAGDSIYTIETSMGDIKIKLYDDTPLHKANFEKLVANHTYDSVLFHRVINHFMIQGGDPNTKPAHLRDPKYSEDDETTIPAEFVKEHYHKKGALAAARMGDQVNPEKRSSPTQFYIVHGRTFTDNELRDIEGAFGTTLTEQQKETYKSLGGTPHLDSNYTVFGEVIEGLGVVNQIAETPTDGRDKPKEDVYIIRVIKDKK